MELISKADVVLALGTRLNPFSTLPGYGLDYWPKNAKLIQVDMNAERIGLTKPVAVGIAGDAKKTAEGILEKLTPEAGNQGRQERRNLIAELKATWSETLAAMDHEDDDPGTSWNLGLVKNSLLTCLREWDGVRSLNLFRKKQSFPRTSVTTAPSGTPIRLLNLGEIPGARPFWSMRIRIPSIIGAKIGNPDTPVVGFAGDGAFGISMNEMTAVGREDWPAITMIIFRNYQWGAEKRNTTLWYSDNFVGTELDLQVSYADIAKACGVKGFRQKAWMS